MTRSRLISLFAAAAALAAGPAIFRAPRLQAQDFAATGMTAPAWRLKDLAGREVSSDQFKGKVVIIDFWATWCEPCLSEIPGYIELQKKYGKDGLVIVGISLDRKSPAYVQKFATEHGMNYQLVMGDEDTVEAFGGFDGIPTTFLINRDGRIVHKKTGAVSHEEYEAIVKQFL